MFAWDAHVFKREASPALPRALAKRVLSAFRCCCSDRRTGLSQQHLKLIWRKNPSDLKAFDALPMHAAAEEG